MFNLLKKWFNEERGARTFDISLPDRRARFFDISIFRWRNTP